MTGDLLRALAVLAEPPTPASGAVTEALGLPRADGAVFTDVFVFRLYPYASVYLGPEGMLGGEARDRVAGFFRVLGGDVPVEPDHLSVLLGAYADLVEKDQAGERSPWHRARSTLLWEHLLSWLPPYLDAIADLGAEPYRSWSSMLLEVLEHEAAVTAAPPQLPLHLRAAPPLQDPRAEGADAFSAGLLTPVRSGMIVTATTLSAAARELGLGLRVAERRYVLRNLFHQDTAATLGWLAEHARRSSAAASRQSWTGAIAEFWRERSAATATLLDTVATEACDFGVMVESA